MHLFHQDKPYHVNVGQYKKQTSMSLSSSFFVFSFIRSLLTIGSVLNMFTAGLVFIVFTLLANYQQAIQHQLLTHSCSPAAAAATSTAAIFCLFIRLTGLFLAYFYVLRKGILGNYIYSSDGYQASDGHRGCKTKQKPTSYSTLSYKHHMWPALMTRLSHAPHSELAANSIMFRLISSQIVPPHF